jgi:hypothetical protein
MWWGLASGFVGALSYLILETIQNVAYTNYGKGGTDVDFSAKQKENPKEHKWHRMFNAPLRYEGIRWHFSPGMRKTDAEARSRFMWLLLPAIAR